MGATGQKTAISFTGFALPTISITPPGYSGESVDMPRVDLDVGDCIPTEPADLISAGEIVVQVEDDESYEPPFYVRQDFTITHRVPSGLSNGATEVYADAYVVNYERGEHTTGTRREATLTIKVDDHPTRNPAS